MINKKKYQRPIIEFIHLDNEISLTLDSSVVPWLDPELYSNTDVSNGVLLSPEAL